MARTNSSEDLQRELNRLARFGANISDAHSCCIFLPLSALEHSPNTPQALRLVAWHSLSSDINEQALLPVQGGLIGWVATHRRAIHVAPFEQESSTLGYYRNSLELKSLIGVPAIFTNPAENKLAGVVMCDSKKSFAFSKLQGKLLEDLAQQIGMTVRLMLQSSTTVSPQHDLETFLTQAELVAAELGPASTEMVRISVTNAPSLERGSGIVGAHETLAQLWRLAQQTLPPHFPTFIHHGTELLICCDNMLSQLLENKLRALSDRVFEPERRPSISIARSGKRAKAPLRPPYRGFVESLIADTVQRAEIHPVGGLRRGVGTA